MKRAVAALGAVSLISTSLLVGALAPLAVASSGTGGAVITGGHCVGDTDTLTWTAPESGILEYKILEQVPSGGQNSLILPADQTSLTFPVSFLGRGQRNYLFILADETMQHGFQTFATATSDSAVQAPSQFNWDGTGPTQIGSSSVGDGTVTVSFLYPELSAFNTGGSNADTLTVFASPGGQVVTEPLQLTITGNGGGRATATFTGLTNGVPYVFNSQVSNECGVGPLSVPTAGLTPRAPHGLYCVVTGVMVPPAVPQAEQFVQVVAADGLASISNIQVVNGTVNADFFSAGTTSPVSVVAQKTTAGQRTVWSFDMTDVNGQTAHCT